LILLVFGARILTKERPPTGQHRSRVSLFLFNLKARAAEFGKALSFGLVTTNPQITAALISPFAGFDGWQFADYYLIDDIYHWTVQAWWI
jgi:hypothetical protein